MKLMDSGFAIWTAVNLGSIAIPNLLHLGVRSSRLRVSWQFVQGNETTIRYGPGHPRVAAKTPRPLGRRLGTAHRIAVQPRGAALRGPPREAKPFTRPVAPSPLVIKSAPFFFPFDLRIFSVQFSHSGASCAACRAFRPGNMTSLRQNQPP